ncbi:hypothetical protein SmaMPs15_000177 [Stenotrophomonas maltophilia phage vB_SmaM_Ps15]|uniref:Uncharacterized protein n=1 Tax=Stenotrophomonas maltophilia phage vB_SmaM_Ps15 TaxID=3071007 RepID=A0AAE9JUB8_9CAUD|nr:hypothetical protein PQC01_gp177 [Stenotrophomonas maltophilia phage vB_SmaM_Ps15]UMO77328.1 hypothetical protein SmaMPs15_000177 [Stenotrophomonas maltophilia phage vB_SmaM_Ps15]
MKIVKFAEKAGVKFSRCDPEWGGTWAYKDSAESNCTFAGFKTKEEAAEFWFNDLVPSAEAGHIMKKAIEAYKEK